MSSRVLAHVDVVQILSSIDPRSKNRILKGLSELAEDPTTTRPKADIRKLRARGYNLFRLRIGIYRVIYAVENNDVLVTDIIHRSRAYREI